ncbi:sensor domain-containing phosphodiesterase [Angustibacter peucedani]
MSAAAEQVPGESTSAQRTRVAFQRVVAAVVLLELVAVSSALLVLSGRGGSSSGRLLAVALLAFCAVGAVAVAGMHRGRQRALAEMAQDRWRLSVHDELPGRLLWETTADGLVTHVGPGSAQLLGYCPGELVGRSMAVVLTETDLPRASDLMRRSLADGTGWTDVPFRYTTKSGDEIELSTSALLHLGADGSPVGFSGILHAVDDLSGRHEVRAVRDQVRSIVEDEALTIVFQPIASAATGVVLGAEALSRFAAEPTMTPDRWFAAAADIGLGTDLELVAVRAALHAARDLPPGLYVSVNVSPSTLVDDRLLEVLAASRWPLARLVVEITEHVSVSDYGRLATAIEALRSRGVRLAVDDAGAGYASFRHILHLRPDHIKLDRTLVDGIHDNPAKRALAGSVVAFGQEVGATVVAEGIETADELRASRALGIQAAQGYFIGRPAPAGRTWGPTPDAGRLAIA